MLAVFALASPAKAVTTHVHSSSRHTVRHTTRSHANRLVRHTVTRAPHYTQGFNAGYRAGLEAARREAAATPASCSVPAHKAAQPQAAGQASEQDDENESSEPPATPEPASLHLRRAGTSASLRGSLASLVRQNQMLEAEGLERIEDEQDLRARIAHKFLVPVPVSAALAINPQLEQTHRYCRPWTAKFLSRLALAYNAAFHQPLEVSSAVRTVSYQRSLRRRNVNAAAADGDVASPHLTGAAVDITKKGMNRQELAWMRRYLLALQDAGKIDVEEEFVEACFHITVYKTYLPQQHAPATSRTRRHHPLVPEQSEMAIDETPRRG